MVVSDSQDFSFHNETDISTTVSTAVYGCSLGVIVGFSVGFFAAVICYERRNASATLNFMKSPLLSYHYKFVFTTQEAAPNHLTRFLGLPHLQKPFFLDILKVLFELMTTLAVCGQVSVSGMLGVWIFLNLVHFAHVISVAVTSRRSEDFQRASVLVLRSGFVYSVVFCSPLLLVGAAYSAQRWTNSAWYTTLDGQHFARYLMVCLVLGSSLCLTFLLFMSIYSLCNRITRRVRTPPRFKWVALVAIVHVLGGMVAFALYHTRPWVTLAFMPLALELAALACALFKAAAVQDEVKRFLGDVVSLLNGAVTLLTVGLVQDYVKYDKMPHNHASFFVLQVIQIVSTVISISVTIVTDGLLVKDLLDVERLARRHRSATTVMQTPRRLSKDHDKRNMFNTIKSLRNKLVNRENDISCCICLDVFASSAMLGVARSCGHHFHIDCINEWMKTKSTCPTCREPITLTGGGLRTITYWDLKKIMFKSIGRPVSRLCSINSLMDEENSNETILDAHFATNNGRRTSGARRNHAFVEEVPNARRNNRTTENTPITSQPEENEVPTSLEF